MLKNFDLCVAVVGVVHLSAQFGLAVLALSDQGSLDALGGHVGVGSQDLGLDFLGDSVDGNLFPSMAEPVGALVASVEGDRVVVDLLDFRDSAQVGAGLPVELLKHALGAGLPLVGDLVLEEQDGLHVSLNLGVSQREV